MNKEQKAKLAAALQQDKNAKHTKLVEKGHDTDAGRAAMKAARGKRGVRRGTDGAEA